MQQRIKNKTRLAPNFARAYFKAKGEMIYFARKPQTKWGI